MATRSQATSKCRQCKQTLENEVYFYNGKTHKTCFSCSKKRVNKKNVCSVCGIRAFFNICGETHGIRCSSHRDPTMVDVITPMCIKCKLKQPYFNKQGETKGLYCADCADPTMVDVKSPKCIKCKLKRPNFNKQGEAKGLYCADCKDATMVNVVDPKCIKCKLKRPNFNKQGETKGLYCADCKDATMVDVRHTKCIKCKIKHPVFNKQGEPKALYCTDCKDATMVNVKHPKCITCRIKRPNFNKQGETKGLYCADCADPTMVDVKNRKCIKCKLKQPNFNKQGETKGLYCADCKDATMVNVVDPKCIMCKTLASYGIPGLTPTMCVKHKTENMISKPRAICKNKTCKAIAIYGIKNPIHCDTHKTDNDINLVETRCTNCGLLDRCIDGLCINTCSNSEQITYEMKRRQKVKELRVLKILEADYRKPDEYNQRVSYDCGGKKSEEKEFCYDFGTHILCFEVDENQHKNYCELGEINRMKNIYMNEGGIPVIFIRYNPDNYYANGKKQKTSQRNREIEFVKWIKYYENIDNLQGYALSVQYLFYNDKDNSKLQHIDPYEVM